MQCDQKQDKGERDMGLPNVSGDFSSEMDVDAFRRLFPLRFYERHLVESIRPDARPLGRARDTTLALGQLTIFYFCFFIFGNVEFFFV